MSMLGPRQRHVGLGVQVQQRLAQRVEAGDPHLRRRERVHPGDHADAVGRRRWPSRHDPADRVGVGEHRLPDDPAPGSPSASSSASAICRDWSATWSRRLRAVQALAAGEEPDLGAGAASHGRLSSVGQRVCAVDVLVAVVERVDVGRRRSAAVRRAGGRCARSGRPSSHITAALTAARAVAADGERAVVPHQHGRASGVAQRLDDAAADRRRRRSARTGRPGSPRRTRRPSR